MADIKFKLTTESITNGRGVKLFRIEATVDIKARNITKGDKGGFVESTHLSNGDAQVSGDAWVYGDAQVSGNAHLSAKAGFNLGWFIGGDDTGKIKDITSETGSTFWENQYVLGDYKIESLEEKVEPKAPKEITIEGATYRLVEKSDD